MNLPFFVFVAVIFCLVFIAGISNQRRRNRNQQLTDLRAIELELLAIEDGAEFSRDGREFSLLLRTSSLSLYIDNGRVRNVITKKYGNHTVYLFDFFGNRLASPSGDDPKIIDTLTGVAVKFKDEEFPYFHIGKNKAGPPGFVEINPQKYPAWLYKSWLNQVTTVFAGRHDQTEILGWLEQNENLAVILNAPTFLAILFRKNFIEVFYTDLLPSEKYGYELLKQRAGFVVNLAKSIRSTDVDEQIKLLKKRERK